MTIEQTVTVLKILKTAYPSFYKGMTRDEMQNVVNLWADLFSADDPKAVAAAVKTLIATDEKGFPPTIGQIKAKIKALTAKPPMTDGEAWAIVRKALTNSGYGYKQEFDKLPPPIKRAVGDAKTLHRWALMEGEQLDTVVASNFARSFRAAQEHAQLLADVPASARAALLPIGETNLLEGGAAT